jgi:hypothetical protein
VWVPAHYVWTPSGYLYVPGYWDFPLADRGLLFAPAFIDRRLRVRRGWFFRPRFVIQPDFLLGALFVRPAVTTYYFGDYFDNRYVRGGYVPWVDWRVNRVVYDPNYAYYRTAYVSVPTWDRGLRALYTARLRGTIARPPRTLVQQTTVINTLTGNKTVNTVVTRNINLTRLQNVSVLTPISRVNNLRVTGLLALAGKNVSVAKIRVKPVVVKLQAVSRADRTRIRTEATRIHRVAAEHRRAEAKILTGGRVPVKHTDKPRPVKVTLPRRTPVAPRGKPPVRRQVPPPPKRPMRQAKPIPKYEPPRSSRPPKGKPDKSPKKGLPPNKKGPPPVKKGPFPTKKNPPPVKKGPPPTKKLPPAKKGPPPNRDKKGRKDKPLRASR